MPRSESRSTAARLRGWIRSDVFWLGTVLVAGVVFWLAGGIRAEEPFHIPPPAGDVVATAAGEPAPLATAVFAAGCFWGVQAVFQHTQGVTRAVSGYAGGTAATANYDQVTSGTTGHAEAVEITYDPSRVSFGQLLHVLFSVVHNPTQLNRQGPDVGTQYRSAIFVTDEGQRRVAAAYIAQLDAAKVYRAPIVTELRPLERFYPAESYHQDFATMFPDHPYIAAFDRPKIANLRSLFPDRFRETPALVRQAAAN
ncbi:MAG: peptide-methionine (S)-S-oxide reductase MsrA [Lautropia sp.]